MTLWAFYAAAIALLSALHDRNAWTYLLSHPGVFDAAAIKSMVFSQLPPLLAVALAGLVAMGLGKNLCDALGVQCRKPSDGCIAAGLGLGVLASSVCLLGAAGLLRPDALGLLATLAVLTALSRSPLKDSVFPLPKFKRPAAWRLCLAIPIAYVAFHSIVSALCPPTGYDATAYHLAISKIYQRAAAIVPIPWLFHSRWPHLMEAFYTAPLIFGCDRAAALLHVLVCILLVLAVFLIAREEFEERHALIAAALLASQPALHYVVADPHSDGALALFHFLACLALWRSIKTGTWGWLIASALLSGWGVSCKLPGLALTAALAATAFWHDRKKGLAFSILACLIFAPWCFKSWRETGDPFWPFLSAAFGGSGHPALLVAGFREFNGWSFPRDLPLLPRYGPHFILLPLALLILPEARKQKFPEFLKFLLLPAAPLALTVCASHEFWRYLLPILPAAALTAAWGTVNLIQPGGWRRLAAVSALVFAISPTLRLSQSNELFYVLGMRSTLNPDAEPRTNYLTRATPYYHFYRKITGFLKPTDKALLFREVRGYHLDIDYQWFEASLQNEITANHWDQPKPVLLELKNRDLTHIIMHRQENWFGSFTPLPPRQIELMERIIGNHTRLIFQENTYSLYEITNDSITP